MKIPLALLMAESSRIDEEIEKFKAVKEYPKEKLNLVLSNLEHRKKEVEKAIKILSEYDG